MELYLIRHLPCDSPKVGAFYGSTDLDLTGKLSEIEVLKQNFGSEFAFYTSPMKRCRRSAKILFPQQKFIELNQAREVDFGDWEGLTFDEINQLDPQAVKQWAENPDFCFPQGESLKAFEERIKCLAAELSTHDKVVLMSHGGVIRHLICYYLGLSFNQSLLFQVDLASLTHLQIFDNDKGVLKGLGIKQWQTYFS